MNVSEFAARAGISAPAVRFYESRGVIPSPRRRKNGYRDYDESDLCRLRLVVALRGLGLDLAECGRLAQLCQDGECTFMQQRLLEQLDERRAAVARARAELDHLERELTAVQQALRDGRRTLPAMCSDGRRSASDARAM